MTANRETPAEPPSQTPSETPSRRNHSRRRRHPAAGTRKVLAAGSVAASLGLTGVLWNATQASSQGTDTDNSTTTYSDDDSSYSDSSDDSVDVAPSYEPPNTTSSAS